jgi:hypothetical protein
MVPRLFPGSTVVCGGSGPSALASDVLFARESGATILAVNSAFELCAPYPDVLFAADAKWWGWHPEAVALPSLKFGFHPTNTPGVKTLDWSLGTGIDPDPARLRGGGHSGYAAINLAVHLGARRIVLLGYDLLPGEQGQHHFHADHPDRSHLHYAARSAIYATLQEPLAALKVTLVNASRRTAIEDVLRLPLKQALVAPLCSP